jgi:hypothetical protein
VSPFLFGLIMEKNYVLQEAAPLTTPEGRKWIIDMLKIGPARIKFIKTDGSDRVMNCTLQEDVVPVVEKKTERVKAANDEVLPVYDLDAKGWRSFRLDSVITVSFDLK